jgi:hypothetical protein
LIQTGIHCGIQNASFIATLHYIRPQWKSLDCREPAALAMTSLRGGEADEAIQFYRQKQ